MKNMRFSATLKGVVILMTASLITLFLPVKSTAASALSVDAKAAVLYVPENDTLLYTKNENVPLPMASTTKIMTALIAIERENLDRTVKIDSRAVGVEGSSAYLQAGEEFSLRELLFALMLRSANDAAEAIAYAISGNLDAFVEIMNEKAVALGLQNTHFTNPHGLDNEEHYTTALDLAKITAAAMEYPEFCEIVSTTTKRIEKNGITRLFSNHNKMLYKYDGCIGVKTGYTKRTGRCLVTAAERDGVRLIAITLSCPNDWQEHEKMLDFGFSTLERITLLKKEDFSQTVEIENGNTTNLSLGIDSDITVIKKIGGESPKISIDIPEKIEAPISIGDTIGKIKLEYPDGQIEEFDIVARHSIKKAKKGLFSLFK